MCSHFPCCWKPLGNKKQVECAVIFHVVGNPLETVSQREEEEREREIEVQIERGMEKMGE